MYLWHTYRDQLNWISESLCWVTLTKFINFVWFGLIPFILNYFYLPKIISSLYLLYAKFVMEAWIIQTHLSAKMLALYVPLMIQFCVVVFLMSFLTLIAPNYFGLYGAFTATLIPLTAAWVFSILSLMVVYEHTTFITIKAFKWFSLPGVLQIQFEFIIDKLSITYVSLILSIGFCVIIYAFSYFRYEPHCDRLFLLINLFMISMCLLVTGGNLFVLFLGWELIGLTSFFLINFWSTKISSLKAAFKAFIFNKVSDLGVLMFIIITLVVTGETNIYTLNKIFKNYLDYNIDLVFHSFSLVELLAFCLMIAICIKSAQFGTHIWLPDSMEAPVPASALIHSATLVSAGVFLILRFDGLFALTPVIIKSLLIISSMTAAFGGVCACFQSDTKRILAYSTISHCGFLIFLACCSNLEVTLLYLCVHGFFKALVFMGVGNIIRFARNYQDFRYMGGFFKFLVFEAVILFVGLVNLSGLPLSFGFFIKHYTLLNIITTTNIFIKINLIIGMTTSIVYSYRLYYYVFFDIKKAKKSIYLVGSKKRFRSTAHSNTTLASNVAILMLYAISTAVVVYIYWQFFLFLDLTVSRTTQDSTVLSNLFSYAEPGSADLWAFYINWLILIIGLILGVAKYRYHGSLFSHINNTSLWVIIFVYLYAFLTVLTLLT